MNSASTKKSTKKSTKTSTKTSIKTSTKTSSKTSTKTTTKYVIKKVGQQLISLLILTIIVFTISRLAPGDPLKAYYGEAMERMSTEQLAAAKEMLGLNDPLPIQYIDWGKAALRGDFGISYQYKQPATDIIDQVIGNTMALTLTSFFLLFVLGLMVSVFCVRHEGKRIDKIICRIGVATNSIPEFFVALILILIFAVNLGILPQSGAATIGTAPIEYSNSIDQVSRMVATIGDRIIHLILPVTAIVISHLWYCTYLMRNKLSDEMRKDYVLMLKVKGLSEKAIVYKHCLKNIMPSIVSIMAIFLPHLLGGAYVVELVFSYPGLGKLGVESAQYHDYNMLMLVCLITGAMVITANIIAQIINEKLDPEIKEERGQLI